MSNAEGFKAVSNHLRSALEVTISNWLWGLHRIVTAPARVPPVTIKVATIQGDSAYISSTLNVELCVLVVNAW